MCQPWKFPSGSMGKLLSFGTGITITVEEE